MEYMTKSTQRVGGYGVFLPSSKSTHGNFFDHQSVINFIQYMVNCQELLPSSK